MKIRIILVVLLSLTAFGVVNAQKKPVPVVLELMPHTVSVTFVNLPAGVKIKEFEAPLYPSGDWFGGKSVQVMLKLKDSEVVDASAISGNPAARFVCEKAAKKIKFETGFKETRLVVKYEFIL